MLKIPILVKAGIFNIFFTIMHLAGKLTLKGQGHDFVKIVFRFLCLQCFISAFLIVNQTLSVNRQVISKILNSQFFVMQTKFVPCFCLHIDFENKIPGLDF